MIEAVELLAAFALGFVAGVVVLIWAQVREAKRRAALSEVLDRRRVGAGPAWIKPDVRRMDAGSAEAGKGHFPDGGHCPQGS